MTNLKYSNYLKDKNFNIKYNYYQLFKKIEKKYNKLKEKYPYSLLFYDIKFKEIIFFKKETLFKIENRIAEQSEKVLGFRKNIKEEIKTIFNYEGNNQRKKITPFFTKNFNFRTCFYCNKDFINNFEEDTDKLVSTFQLDHFYDKGTYPYLALSFYNLIPSCPTCNSSKVKGSKNTFTHDSNVGRYKNETCLSPNDKKFDFHNKVKFKLFLDKDSKHLQIKSKDDLEIPLKEQFTNDYDKYIEVFKLNERYKAHKDIVYDMIQKAELYPESRLKELENLTGIPFQQIKKDIFNLIDKNEDLSKKPFSKLIKDISEELGLTK
ncbi:MAG: hypothetical protein CL623_04740 [Arcobacter sp.]|nr:hypothetical protein [Arcobacter sp.]|tara:strand:- start:16296 stop:17258 length:963 start_codon:yes stop_codon:yes gene_type:complete